MRRREFIAAIGAAASSVSWPLAARAQERVRRVGVLIGAPADADDADGHARVVAFQQAMRSWAGSKAATCRSISAGGGGDAERIRQYAVELAALAPDVILTAGASTVQPLLQATRTVPIVFTTVVDPVGAGFVDSLARPGGNATGFMQFEYSLAGNGWSCSSRSRRA